MKAMTCRSGIFAVAFALSGCAAMEDSMRDTMGHPSPAVAMYAAQLQFAHATCAPRMPGLDPDKSASFSTVSGERGLATAHYMQNYPEFRQGLAEALGKYRATYNGMPQYRRDAFCAAYASDVAGSGGTFRMTGRSDRFRTYFSPPTAEAHERARKGAMVLGVLSLGATAAGVRQADRGNFDGASSLNQVGGQLADGIATPNASSACNSYRPFTQAAAPAGSGVWQQYHSIRSCN